MVIRASRGAAGCRRHELKTGPLAAAASHIEIDPFQAISLEGRLTEEINTFSFLETRSVF